MSLIVLKFTPDTSGPVVAVLKESLDQIQAAVGTGGLNAKTVNIGPYRMVLITDNNACERGLPVCRMHNGIPIHGNFLLCGDGKGASIVSVPLGLLGYMKHTAGKVFGLPDGVEGGRIA